MGSAQTPNKPQVQQATVDRHTGLLDHPQSILVSAAITFERCSSMVPLSAAYGSGAQTTLVLSADHVFEDCGLPVGQQGMSSWRPRCHHSTPPITSGAWPEWAGAASC